MTVIGKYNNTSSNNNLLIVGNGSSNNSRSNILEVKTNEVIINNYINETGHLKLDNVNFFCVKGTLSFATNQGWAVNNRFNVGCIACGYQFINTKQTIFLSIQTTDFVTITEQKWVCVEKISFNNKTFTFSYWVDNANKNHRMLGLWHASSRGNSGQSPHVHTYYSGGIYYGHNSNYSSSTVNPGLYLFNMNGEGFNSWNTSTPFHIIITNLFLNMNDYLIVNNNFKIVE